MYYLPKSNNIISVIEFPPKIVDYEKVYRVKKGSDVTIFVQYEANPPPNDEWVVNSKIIKKSKHTKPTIDSMSANLTIKKTDNNDAGTYKLRLENNCGYTEIDIEVVILGKFNLLLSNLSTIGYKLTF